MEWNPDALAPEPKPHPCRVHPASRGLMTAPGSSGASTVLTLRLWLLRVTHSQGSCFGFFFVSPNGGIELLVINWIERDQGTRQTKYGNLGGGGGGGGKPTGQGCLPRAAYIGCAARNSRPCWWARKTSRCLSSCSAALPADGPWHPPWK